MTDQLQSQTREPQVQDLTSDELDHVSGGGSSHTGGVLVALGDGSVRNVDAGDYVLWRKTLGSNG